MFELKGNTIYLLFAIIILYILYNRNKKHDFWDKQPVNRDSSIQSSSNIILIKDLTPENTKLEDLPDTIKRDKVNVILAIDKTKFGSFLSKSYNGGEEWRLFINDNYIKFTKYTKQYIDWILHYPTKNFPALHLYPIDHWNLILRNKKNKIVGSIRAAPIEMSIHNNKFYMFYVDFLCVHKSARKIGLAPKLISDMVHQGALPPFQSFVFKKEKKPLPFEYITKAHYYILNLDQNNSNCLIQTRTPNNLIHKLDEDTPSSTITKLYEFVSKESSRYPIHPIFMLTQFSYLFTSRHNTVYTYYIEDPKTRTIIGFVSFLHYVSKVKTTEYNFLELFYAFINPNYGEYTLNSFILTLIPRLKKMGYTYLLCTNTQDYELIIHSLGFTKLEPLYIHFYNLSAPRTPTKDICFNMP